MIINDLDLGQFSPNQGPSSGQDLGMAFVEGSGAVVWPRGGKKTTRSTTINVQAPFAIGGAAAGSRQAVRYAVQQLLELSRNPDINPVYIQWESGHGNTVINANDGWYVLEDATPLDFTFNSFVPCQITATLVALGGTASVPGVRSMAYVGGALSTDYSGPAINLISLPASSTGLEGLIYSRIAGSAAGAVSIPTIPSPVVNPEPFVPPSALATFFRGGVQVFDTMVANPVPLDGTFASPNWVEVFHPDHNFTGLCVITNGLLLLTFLPGSIPAGCYLWNTALATPAWQFFANLNYLDNGGIGCTLRNFSLLRINREEASIRLVGQNAINNHIALLTLRLQRGRYEARVEFTPQTQVTTSQNRLMLSFPATPKIFYNSVKAGDVVLDTGNLAPPTDFGYSAAFIASATYPFVAGFLYQKKPTSGQPLSNGNPNLGLGDSASAALGSSTFYGIFAFPIGALANLLTPNQASLEVDTTGWAATLNCTISRTTAQAIFGAGALQMSSTAGGRMDAGTPGGTGGIPVTPLAQYTAFAYFRANTTGQTVKVYLVWYQASGAASSHPSDVSSGIVDSNGGWSVQLSVTANAPADAAFAQVVVSVNNTAGAGEIHYCDGISIAAGSNIAFFGGLSSTQNLQAEAEGGTLDAGWSSQANGAASAGNEAKCVSGTVTSRADTFPTIPFRWLEPYPLFDVWFRVKVTSAAGGSNEMRLGMWNSTAAAFSISTDLKPNQVGTGYTWIRVGVAWNPNTFNSLFQFRAQTIATLGTDWFIDEAVIVPTLNSGNGAIMCPQDLWQQFMYDRDVEMVVGA